MVVRLPVWVRRCLVGLLALVGFFVLVELATTVLRIVSWRTHWQLGIDAIRCYNKRVENPLNLKIGGKRIASIHHTGRRSGREYVTPVWAERFGQSFFIQLPYGIDVDWCRNVLAGGGCGLQHDGVCYEVVAPEIVPAAEASAFLSRGLGGMQRLARVESYLRLDISSAETPVKKAG